MQNIEAFQNQSPHIGQDVFIHSSASVIGDVHINQDSSIWPGTVIRGDVNFIHIGVIR
jgi:carbonic anhydrase/acetyltransferase-like protein (isoleucine patch superfamily)